ncbi:S8 family peptidase [Shewanella baltica]|uniref:S8 family peptidase n=1 Tax=Shewanella baltica TaxID=62322 RepID=UPI003CFEB7AF
MPSNPLLTFRPPKVDLPRGNLRGGPTNIVIPSSSSQAQRILPKVAELQKQLAEHASLSLSMNGFQPEKVLVLEIAGNVQDIIKAMSKVSGLEFIGEDLLDDNFVDDLFYEKTKKEVKKATIKKAYLAMSSQTGLQKLYYLWQRFVSYNEIPDGYTPLIHAFRQLVDIRFWDTQDRLEATYLLEDWNYRVDDTQSNIAQATSVPFEIELWFKSNATARHQSENYISNVIKECGGVIKKSFIHSGIHYHALLGDLPIEKVQQVLKTGATSLSLMRCDEVMFFRPIGQCVIPSVDTLELTGNSLHFQPRHSANESPTIALLDGLPMYGHEALVNRVRIDDPDDFESFYSDAKEQVHGTSMASIIIHGDLNSGSLPLETPLYVRPILAPGKPLSNGVRLEQIPEVYLPVDLIHRAVLRMKVGENGNPPSAPDVVVINLSVCDPYRLFDTQMSPWARMLDWLSYKFNVLFVVSAGNFSSRLEFSGINEDTFNQMNHTDREKELVRLLASRKHGFRMMSPAESINSLTVKAAHIDGYSGNIPSALIDLLNTSGMFSPINPITLGRKSSVKPEVMLPGGRIFYINRTMTSTQDVLFDPSLNASIGPGIKSAIPSGISGALNTYGFTSGTSNAAAMATRRLAQLYETLQNLKVFDENNALDRAPISTVLKALLVHGAEHPEIVTNVLENALKVKSNSRTFKSDIDQFLGFGLVDEKRIHACSDEQATLIYTGVIKEEESHQYKLPLPPSLSATTHERRLIVTLAWMTPVDFSHPEYRLAQLWIEHDKSMVKAEDGDYYQHHMLNGTVYHDIRKGSKAANFTESDELTISVNCHARVEGIQFEIPYALVVTLDAPGSGLLIYEEVKQKLSIVTSQQVHTEASININ